MKKMFRSLVLLGAIAFASTAFAAQADYYLKIEGKGVSRVVDCSSGACTVSNLAPGDYTVTACAKDGKPLDAQAAASHEIKSPRDVATGQASGKRMHKPITITKEWSASSPLLKVTVPEQDCPLELRCTPKTGYDVKKSEKA